MKDLHYNFSPRPGHDELEKAFPDRPEILLYEKTIRSTAHIDEPVKIAADARLGLRKRQINLLTMPGKDPVIIITVGDHQVDEVRALVKTHCTHLTEASVQ